MKNILVCLTLFTCLEHLTKHTELNMQFFKAADEFKKNPQLKEEDLNHLREWLTKQPHLPHVTGKHYY